MHNDHLHITLVQPDMVWEDKAANLEHYTKLLDAGRDHRHIVVLPEMFTTGFSMQPEQLAEPMTGHSVQWMKHMAHKHRCIITGSLIIEEDSKYYNRLLWVQPDGAVFHYDKRHLFGYGGEDKHYAPGSKRTIVQVNGWRINLQVCYDLRFPVWARNAGTEYDVLMYVANWPCQRSLAWKTLLQARAIENMCYVVGVNRVGADAKGNMYSGDSSLIGPLGEVIWQQADAEACTTVVLEKQALSDARSTFPFLKDADGFVIM